MSENPEGCVKPTPGPIMSAPKETTEEKLITKEVPMVQAQVGKPAPDFELSAYVGGGFKNILQSVLTVVSPTKSGRKLN